MTDENKVFYKTLVMLCIPIIIQNLISTLVNMVDTVMVGSLGEVSVASIGIANQYFFLFNMALSGIIGGAGIFMAQFYGKGDKDSIKKITGLSVYTSCIFPKCNNSLFLSRPISCERSEIIFFSYRILLSNYGN